MKVSYKQSTKNQLHLVVYCVHSEFCSQKGNTEDTTPPAPWPEKGFLSSSKPSCLFSSLNVFHSKSLLPYLASFRWQRTCQTVNLFTPTPSVPWAIISAQLYSFHYNIIHSQQQALNLLFNHISTVQPSCALLNALSLSKQIPLYPAQDISQAAKTQNEKQSR